MSITLINSIFDIIPTLKQILNMNLLDLKLKLEELLPTWKWTLPPKPELGLLSSAKAFEEAKLQGKNPSVVATDLLVILENVILKNNLPIKANVTGPYLNVQAKQEFLIELAKDLENNFRLIQSNKKVLLEYVSPNVAKPLHAGHLVNAVIGESLKQILNLKYKNLETEIYWGDWGIQFGIILWAVGQIGEKKVELILNGETANLSLNEYDTSPIDTLVKVYVWGNQQKEKVENFDEQIRSEVLKLESGDEKSLELWEKYCKDSKKVIRQTLNKIGLGKFDHEFGESYYQERMKILNSFMDKNQLWEVEEKGRFIDLDKMSASWEKLSLLKQELTLKSDSESKTGDENSEIEQIIPFKTIATYGRCYLIQSKDGYSTYPFRDVAARWHWADDLKADIMITLTDHTQSHNFHQAFSIVSYLAANPEFLSLSSREVANRLKLKNLVHIPYGFLKLPEGKMSTRNGNFVTFNDILEAIQTEAKSNLEARYPDLVKNELEHRSLILSLAAIKWTILSKDIIKDTVLNIPQILTFEGNTGVYQLYTFARLNSILTKNGVNLETNPELNLNFLSLDELTILNYLNQLPIILEEICSSYKPHSLSNYLFNLATMVNSWYTKVNVTNEKDSERKASLLAFCQLLAKHLEETLSLMGIETLESL